VYATDQGSNPGQNTGSATYTVLLSDENDNDPVIQNTPYDTSISEDTPVNTVVFSISATDADANQNSILTYSISGGNTNTDFRIDSGSGLIQVSNTLDRETTDQYLLEVTVVDAGATPRSAIVTATVTVTDVNDNYPIFQPDPTTTYSFSVSEQVPSGSPVDSVSALDADIGANGAVTFSVASFITGDSSHFALDTASGAITTAATLDRETQDTYVLIVRASDGGTGPKTATVTVTITVLDYNDNNPAFSQALYTGTVTENDAASTSILTVVITDLDINQNAAITLTISDPTANMYIAADSTTYILSVKSPIDREAIDFFSFTLTATDGGTPALSITTQIEITVNDVNDNAPVFSPTFYNSEIAYNDRCQVTATTLTATDADIGVNAAFTYSVTQNDNPQLFSLNQQTGKLNIHFHFFNYMYIYVCEWVIIIIINKYWCCNANHIATFIDKRMPSHFCLNIGAVTLTSTATAQQKYEIYATATDQGTPPLTSASSVTVRVDTYNPSSVILNYYMSISTATYLASEATFLSQLTTLYQVTYPTAVAKRWCVASNGAK